MELDDAIKNRRSIRKFKDKKIPPEDVYKLIDAAQWAPSASNLQLWRFVAVDEKRIKENLVEKAGSSALVKDAPIVIVVLYQSNFHTKKHANIQTASACVQNMLLKAHELGLGGLWLLGMGDLKVVKKILSIPEDYTIITFVLFGYPAESLPPPPRKKADALVSFNSFNFPSNGIYPVREPIKKWNINQIIKYRNDLIRQTSPRGDVYPYGTKTEFSEEIETVCSWLKGKGILELLPYAGTHTVSIVTRRRFERYVLYELSEQPIIFLTERVKREGISQKFEHVISNPNHIPLPTESIDAVICLQKLETLPHLGILNEVKRVLKPQGDLILSFRNRESYYGPYYWYKYRFKEKRGNHLKLFQPLSYSSMTSKIKKSGFNINEEIGISLLPFQRGRRINPPFSRICKLVLFKCKRE